MLTVLSMTVRNVDIKLQFEQTDMTPGPAGRVFMRNVRVHGGKIVDDHGESLADCLMRQDAGAQDAAGNPIAGLVIPNGQGQLLAMRLRTKRLKASYSYMIAHIHDDATLTLLGEPPFFQNGPNVYDYVRQQIVIAVSATELEDMTVRWYGLDILVEVGIHENTIKDTLKLLRAENHERPDPDKFSDDAIAEKLLSMIAKASRTFSEGALKELNAIEGVPGVPGVRWYQLGQPPVNAGVQPPRPRDLNGIVNYYHEQ